MKAISFSENGLPIEDPAALQDVDIPEPTPGPRDLLVEVQAVSVNPVDTKVRAGTFTREPKILGWDAAGIVRQVGDQVSLFKPDDAARPVARSCWKDFRSQLLGAIAQSDWRPATADRHHPGLDP
jgi:NADPH:quinone reductase-like Zn-dependent oxidoreductase